LLVASNVFVRTKLYLLILNKKNAPHECGNPKCKAIALLLAIGRTIPSRSSTSAGCFACKQDSGRAKALGARRQCQTAPTRMRRARRGSIVKAAALYTNWLAPGFNIDSRERVYSERQNPNCPLNFRALASQSVRELISISNCSHNSLAKTLNW
jgi:hypothetical protein